MAHDRFCLRPFLSFRSSLSLACIAAATTLLLAPAGASAATLTLDAGGRLLGASGVQVGGAAYDVQFRDGTCAALFSGCDAGSDFVFNTQQSARAASLALLDQVFNAFTAYDLAPASTRGCEITSVCWVLTAFQPLLDAGGTPQVGTFLMANDARDAYDAVSPLGNQLVLGRTQDIAGSSGVAGYTTYAVWAVATTGSVPEPATALLVALGLAAAVGTRRR